MLNLEDYQAYFRRDDYDLILSVLMDYKKISAVVDPDFEYHYFYSEIDDLVRRITHICVLMDKNSESEEVDE